MFGKQKIRVDIIGPTGLRGKNYPIEGNQVIIQKGRPGPGGAAYKAEFDRNCLLPYHAGFWPLKKLKQKLLLIEGADKCISFQFMNAYAEIDTPIWDAETERNLFKANVIKAAGATVQKLQVPVAVYLMLGLVLVLQFVSFLVASGKVRFV